MFLDSWSSICGSWAWDINIRTDYKTDTHTSLYIHTHTDTHQSAICSVSTHMHGQYTAGDEFTVLSDAEVPRLYPHHVVEHELQVQAPFYTHLQQFTGLWSVYSSWTLCRDAYRLHLCSQMQNIHYMFTTRVVSWGWLHFWRKTSKRWSGLQQPDLGFIQQWPFKELRNCHVNLPCFLKTLFAQDSIQIFALFLQKLEHCICSYKELSVCFASVFCFCLTLKSISDQLQVIFFYSVISVWHCGNTKWHKNTPVWTWAFHSGWPWCTDHSQGRQSCCGRTPWDVWAHSRARWHRPRIYSGSTLESTSDQLLQKWREKTGEAWDGAKCIQHVVSLWL